MQYVKNSSHRVKYDVMRETLVTKDSLRGDFYSGVIDVSNLKEKIHQRTQPCHF